MFPVSANVTRGTYSARLFLGSCLVSNSQKGNCHDEPDKTDNHSPSEMILPNNVEVSSVTALALLAERPNGSREILIGAGYISMSQGLPRERNVRLTYDKAADQTGAPEGYEIYRIKPAEPLQAGEYAFMVNKPGGGDMGAFAGAGIAYNFYELGVD